MEATEKDTTTEARIAALAKFDGCEADDVSEASYGDNAFEIGKREFLVLTDAEADEAVAASIKDSLWAFNSTFIVSECDLPMELAEVFQAFQSDKCESANDAIEALIEKTCGLDAFVKAAVSADGRGHFLSGYDGHENEEGAFYIYRTN